LPLGGSPRSEPYEVFDAILAALPRLPEEFTREGVLEALAFTPSTLYQALQTLIEDRRIAVARSGGGRRPAIYGRKT
jgi:hypothetical protein